MQELCTPDQVYLCDGSEEEYQSLIDGLVSSHVFIPLKRPGSYLCRSDPRDVARVEDRTFICSLSEEDAGPTNHWRAPHEMKEHLQSLFKGCMQGRTMYVVPFCMGPLDSELSLVGVQITDSPYVVVNMKIMTRMGQKALALLEKRGTFVPCLHSVGVPLKKEDSDSAWPCNPEATCIAHFPETREIWSFGSGYGGNALLGKKCLALRIASVIARDEGWFAEHMLIMGITSPQGEKKYIAASFPSACGKTNLAMLTPTLKGWTIECVGDDIAWMRFGKDGQLYAINPEAGCFGVAPGTSLNSNQHAIEMITRNTIFTNVALTDEGDVWWEGMTKDIPSHLIDWKGKDWSPNSETPAAHPNARFTVPLAQCPIVDPAYEAPLGVPISAIIFGGRREDSMPLILESLSWQHGTFLGAALSSEMTAAAAGVLGKVRHDPFAMLPFCGYHMGDYFKHWLDMGKKSTKLPRIFHVNWFRKGADGQFLWPGYGENSRVLKWVFERVSLTAEAEKTPIGYMPTSLDMTGLKVSFEVMKELLSCDREGWLREVENLESYFIQFGNRLPQGITEELKSLRERLSC
ncbi:MAG: phosphoenolpyruvate carboxykinase (GTP) [Simkaniaceae bacterium]|nr:phosphoenolpyruvate carboxykinase (GTP) [Simkaniaceae bacterium]